LVAEHSQHDLLTLDERINKVTQNISDLKNQLSKNPAAPKELSDQVAKTEARLKFLQDIKTNPTKLFESRAENVLTPKGKDLLGGSYP